MPKKMRTVQGVADWRLCLGCGACAYVCPEQKIALFDFLDEGVRPRVTNEDCGICRLCMEVCPAHANDHRELATRAGIDRSLSGVFGPVLEVWEGYAVDPEIRHRGASGGLLTALTLFCLEREGMHGVLHTGGQPGDPLRNQTRLSRSRQELLSCTGSRYSPGSVCDGLDLVEAAPAPCVVVGQPVEVTALRRAERLRPGLAGKVGLALSFFCAGSPATRGTVELLRSRGYDPAGVAEIRYRGLGWPGMFAVRRRGETALTPLMTYQESWGFLQKHRPHAVHLNPDNSGEHADVSCADPWYRELVPGEAGRSLVVVRTELGRDLLHRAVAAGSVQLERVDTVRVMESQRNLAVKRGAIWGRVAAMRLLGVPAPRLAGFHLFAGWWQSSWSAKIKSFFGTLRRVFSRGYRRPVRWDEATAVPVQTAGVGARRPVHGAGRVPVICLMGASPATGNRGVSALAAALVKLVKGVCPPAQVAFLVGLRERRTFAVWTGETVCQVPVINHRLSPKGKLDEQLGVILVLALVYRWLPVRWVRRWITEHCGWIHAVVEADFVGDIRGGDSFSDIYGLRRFVVGSLPVLAVIWLRGRIALLPQTYGPFRSPLARWLARYLLRRADPVMARDRRSAERAGELAGGSVPVACSPDVAFVLPAREPSGLRVTPGLNGSPAGEWVGLNVSGLMFHGGYTRDNMFGLRWDYARFLGRLATQLLEDPGCRLLLIPHTFAPPGNAESDPEACAALKAQLGPKFQDRVHLVEGEYDQCEIKGVIGRCSFFIGSRMHACIAALSQGIPTVAIAYSGKFDGVFEMVGAQEAVIDGRVCDEEEALRRAGDLWRRRGELRAELSRRVPAAQGELRAQFARMLLPHCPGEAGSRTGPALDQESVCQSGT